MAFRVLVDPAALVEAEQALLWHRHRAPREAGRWFHGLWAAIDSLQEMPTRCPLAPESLALRQSIRQLLFGRPPAV
jgi:plasmid stabilization system protein ParE